MFERLKRALDQALDRLEDRLDLSDDDIDRLLRGMREELVDAKSRGPELEAQLAQHEARHAREITKIEECIRRADRAREIDDEETLEVALKFAERHKDQLHLLEAKIETTRAEIALNREEVDEMTAQLKDAMKRRDALGAQARRSKTIDTLRGGSGHEVVDQFDRMVDKFERGEDIDEAERELDLDLGGGSAPRTPDPRHSREHRESEAERMLDELKRRMGMDSDES